MKKREMDGGKEGGRGGEGNKEEGTEEGRGPSDDFNVVNVQ